MRIAILGTDNLGKNLAIHWARGGHDLSLADSRDLSQPMDPVKEIGAGCRVCRPSEAVSEAEVVVLTVPWLRRPDIYRAVGSGNFQGKIVIDAMNPYTNYPAIEDLGGKPSSAVIAGELPGARLVKAFNTIYFVVLANEARRESAGEERLAIPVAGDDGQAKQVVSRLVEEIGFTPIDIGRLSESRIQEPGQALYDKDFLPVDVRQILKNRK